MNLQDLVDATGVPARTIRSWIDLGLVPRPSGPGPKATYPPDALPRVLAVRALRQADGESLSDIRRRLHAADDATIQALAAREVPAEAAPREAASPSSAADYLANLRAQGAWGGSTRAPAPRAPVPAPAPAALAAPGREPSRSSPSTAPRARTFTAFRVGPSAELIVREPLTPDEVEAWERIAHRVRAIIQGGLP